MTLHSGFLVVFDADQNYQVAHIALSSSARYMAPASCYFQGYDFGRMKQVIDDALKAFGPVKPRKVKPVEIHPYRGKGMMRDGSVSLAE